MHHVHMNATRRTSKPSTDPRKAVAYIRVSTEDQHLGPDAQRAALAVWAERNGVTIVATFEDKGVSGGAAIDRRPGLMAALDALAEHGAGVLAVAKRDRLARDTMIAAMAERLAERAGARIVSADGVGEGNDPAAALLRGMVDLFAAYERAMIRTRTVAALAQKKARGERTGAVPVGCRVAADGRTLEADPVEAEIVAAVVKARAAGLSIREIAAELAAAGMRTRKGGEIQSTQVARILRRAA